MRGTKLYTLEGLETRPTLDRVKEPLFSIISSKLPDAIVLDLFSGTGNLGLEAISRGASKVFLCDNSKLAIDIIKKNVQKTRTEEKVTILNKEYKKSLLNKDGIIIVETDEGNRLKTNIEKMCVNIYDERKYGRVSLLFLCIQERKM